MVTKERRANYLGVSVDALPDGRGRHGNHAKGPSHPRWNGGRTITSHGYVRMQVGKEHHLADPNGYAYEHDLVAEEKIGRRLKPTEIVHHIDGLRTNNSPDNLQVMPRGEHWHGKQRNPTSGQFKKAAP